MKQVNKPLMGRFATEENTVLVNHVERRYIRMESVHFAENWQVVFDEGNFELSSWDSNTESWCELKVFGGDQVLKFQQLVTVLWENGDIEQEVQDWLHDVISQMVSILRGRNF